MLVVSLTAVRMAWTKVLYLQEGRGWLVAWSSFWVPNLMHVHALPMVRCVPVSAFWPGSPLTLALGLVFSLHSSFSFEVSFGCLGSSPLNGPLLLPITSDSISLGSLVLVFSFLSSESCCSLYRVGADPPIALTIAEVHNLLLPLVCFSVWLLKIILS